MKTRTNGAVKTNGNTKLESLLSSLNGEKMPRQEALALSDVFRSKADELQKAADPVMRFLDAEKRRELETQRKWEDEAGGRTKTIDLTVPAWVYGFLCQAMVVHDLSSPGEAAALFLQENITEWINEGCYVKE